jgi:hypothetical protein
MLRVFNLAKLSSTDCSANAHARLAAQPALQAVRRFPVVGSPSLIRTFQAAPFAKALDSELTLQISNDGTNEQSNVVTTPRPAAISIAPACIAVIALGRTSPAAATTRIPSV